jgi:DNA-directed RNA polymerase specialized sigma24 family protein
MSKVDVLGLLKIVDTAARRATDDTSLREDIKQDAWVAALECAVRFRGENGASLASYANRAIRLTTQISRTRMRLPVTAPRNRYTELRKVLHAVELPSESTCARGVAARQSMTDGKDWLAKLDNEVQERGASASANAGLETSQLLDQVHALIQKSRHPEAVADVILEAEPLEGAAAAHGIAYSVLRNDVLHARKRIRNDAVIRGAYADRFAGVPMVRMLRRTTACATK